MLKLQREDMGGRKYNLKSELILKKTKTKEKTCDYRLQGNLQLRSRELWGPFGQATSGSISNSKNKEIEARITHFQFL